VNNANNVAPEVIAITVLRCAGDSQRSDVHREHKLGQVTRPSTRVSTISTAQKYEIARYSALERQRFFSRGETDKSRSIGSGELAFVYPHFRPGSYKKKHNRSPFDVYRLIVPRTAYRGN